MKKFISLLAASMIAVFACTPKVTPDKPNEGGNTENPGGGTTVNPPVEEEEFPKLIWIDAETNYFRFQQKANIIAFLDKIKDAGFNTVVVDVTSGGGYAMYPSKVVPVATTVGKANFNTSFDYLGYFIEKAHAKGMKVIASTAMFIKGTTSTQEGLAYVEPWKNYTCVEYTMAGLKDCKRPESTKVGPFLSPFYPEVQDFLLGMVNEVASNYDIDGYALDYCRFLDQENDFSDAARAAFEAYLGTPVARWPQDVFTWNGNGGVNPGTYYKQWCTFKAKTVRDFIAKARQTIKAANPDCDVHYWAASWWAGLYGTGQNWASPSRGAAQEKWSWGGTWFSDQYAAQGFANQLDVFQLGAYLNVVYGPNDVNSIENAIIRAKDMIGTDCKIYGTVSCADKDFDLAGGIKVCMEQTDGLMVFDLVHVINHNWWATIKAAIAEAEAK